MNPIALVKRFLEMDKYVSTYRKKEILKTQRIIAFIASVGFFIFSIINLAINKTPGLDLMLLATTIGAVVLALAFGLSFVVKDGYPLRYGFYAVLVVMLPLFVLTAGNDGFAALWIVLVTYLMMNSIDFRVGFLINVLYFILLFVTFLTPLGQYLFINENAPAIYGEQFLARFPFFFLVNFAFATYVIGSIRVYQYRLLIHQKKLEDLSIRDLNTDLYNRNAYINLCKKDVVKPGQSVAVVYVDANGLHELNNTKGHAAGDLMLHTIADVMKEVFGAKRSYRLGGDEFASYVLDVTEKEAQEMTDRAVDEMQKRGYSVSAGLCWSNLSTDLTAITTEANTTMLKNKANYYSSMENDRRRSGT